MVLRKDCFSAMRINWRDKATNMREIAGELNIGLDSIVYFDDSVVERELIRSLLPEVRVVGVPSDTSRYPETVRTLIDFERLMLTEEDLGRNTMYAANKKRAEAQGKSGHMSSSSIPMNTTCRGSPSSYRKQTSSI
jgi:FkbH-like protein